MRGYQGICNDGRVRSRRWLDMTLPKLRSAKSCEVFQWLFTGHNAREVTSGRVDDYTNLIVIVLGEPLALHNAIVNRALVFDDHLTLWWGLTCREDRHGAK